MKHKWKKDENGEPDVFSWDDDFGNGTTCLSCGTEVCIYSCQGWQDLDDCVGAPDKDNTPLPSTVHYYALIIEGDGENKPLVADWHEVSETLAKLLTKEGISIKKTIEKELLP
jgi:hypothetical protein